MTISEIQLYDLLRPKIGDSEARQLLHHIEQISEEKIAAKKDVFLTKDDKLDLVKEIKDAKVESIRWAFIFWIGQVAVIAGLLTFFFRH